MAPFCLSARCHHSTPPHPLPHHLQHGRRVGDNLRVDGTQRWDTVSTGMLHTCVEGLQEGESPVGQQSSLYESY